jgi:hypothetical protein
MVHDRRIREEAPMAEPEVGEWCRCIPKPDVGGGSFVGRVMEVGDGYVKLRRDGEEEGTETSISIEDYEIETAFPRDAEPGR